MADSERIARIEWKLNLILHLLLSGGEVANLPSFAEEAEGGWCPVCRRSLKFSIDTAAEEVVMTCGCKAPVRIVPGISGLLNSPTEDSHGRKAESSEADPGQRSAEDHSGPQE